MKNGIIQRRDFLKFSAALGTMCLSGCSAASFLAKPDKKPNIIFILADDLGYGDVSCCNPGSKINTVHMDKIAAEGMLFTDAHSGSAVCTPTRYGVLSGRYSWRTHLQNGVFWGYQKALITPDRLNVASLLKQNGYNTGCVGKWHIGWDWALKDGYMPFDQKDGPKPSDVDFTKPFTNGPTDIGFDYYYGIRASLDMHPYTFIENDHCVELPTENKALYGNRKGPAGPNFKFIDVLPRFTEKAVGFIDQQAKQDEPFFLYLPLNSPHTPIAPSKEFQGKSGIGDYGDFVLQTDDTIGQITAALDRNGINDNTLIIVTSDNGCSPAANLKNLTKHGHDPNYIYRGYKADIYDGGHRIPFIARWPGKVKAKTICDDTICLTNLIATCADIVGTKLPDNAAEDSFSILPDLLGIATEPTHEAVVHHSISGAFAIRQGKWKLELCPGSGGWSAPLPNQAKKQGLPPIQLYNIESDTEEKNNLYLQHPEVVNRLTDLMQKYITNGRSRPGVIVKNDTEILFYKNK
ncbi:MAG: sulfatase-like hydrolase/transferase [Phycisphaerae bacterium]|nr:sulfatase-like hydrolase/transferase [Phycisphaerae bacterium]